MNNLSTKEQLKNIFFVMSSCTIITSLVFTTLIGCGVAKKAVNIEKEAVKGKIEAKDNDFNVNPELIAAFKSEINKTIAKKIDNLNQTTNSGILSGGAPYLVAVIFGLISLIQWMMGKETKRKLYNSKEQVEKQHELIRELAVRSKKELDEAQYKAKISMIRGKNEEQEE